MTAAPVGVEMIDDLHPIDVVEKLAEQHDWDFDRVTEDQIAMAVEGSWRTYSLTLAWSKNDDTLRLICTFELDPPIERLPCLFDLLNRCNDKVWTGAFTWWPEEKMIVWRYGLVVNPEMMIAPMQIDRIIAAAVMSSERFYPAIQLAMWSDESPDEALKVALGECFGRA